MWMNYFEQKLKKKLKDLDKQHTLELDALFQKEKKNGRDMVLVVESPQLDPRRNKETIESPGQRLNYPSSPFIHDVVQIASQAEATTVEDDLCIPGQGKMKKRHSNHIVDVPVVSSNGNDNDLVGITDIESIDLPSSTLEHFGIVYWIPVSSTVLDAPQLGSNRAENIVDVCNNVVAVNVSSPNTGSLTTDSTLDVMSEHAEDSGVQNTCDDPPSQETTMTSLV